MSRNWHPNARYELHEPPSGGYGSERLSSERTKLEAFARAGAEAARLSGSVLITDTMAHAGSVGQWRVHPDGTFDAL